ncbi:hypothetical protein V9T40_001272 [Parthenolecanium corni]|uniref:Ig-like domain-containing protein n=1 Tax=Parthenolecanium corni TaxID=536013 RepID=A0AAN9TAX5_9HEMI
MLRLRFPGKSHGNRRISNWLPGRHGHLPPRRLPPSIRTTPANGLLTARKGGSITLECKASGNPVPNIMWSRKDSSLPSGEKTIEGFSITLDKVDRHQAGVYQCTASNGVGDPVTVDMQLDVLYPPEIEVERNWIHTGEGYEAQLVCIVHGEPLPDVAWFQDSFILDPTDRRTMEARGNKYTLTIKNVQSADFGNYSCQGENNLGKSRKYMELSGRPTPAEFRSLPNSRSKDSYNLTWLIESYPPLDEVRLLYRKLTMNSTHQQPGQWHDVLVIPVNGDSYSHHMSYNIRNLEPGLAYEAIVQAKNRYGWNEVSDLYQFTTRGLNEEDNMVEPDMKDLELVASDNSAADLNITKEEYDDELRTFLTPGQIRFHNKFILSVLSKCSSNVLPSSPFILSELDLEPEPKRLKLEGLAPLFKNLPPLDPHNHLEQVVPKTLSEELISKGLLNFLPDHDVVHARMMLHAWERDLEGVEDDACKLIIESTYTFARNLLTATISRRSGFKIKDQHLVHSHGLPVANPWLRNAAKYDFNNRCEPTEIIDQDDFLHIPKMKPSLNEAEESIALELALSSRNTQILRCRPISVDDIIDTLMVYPNLIPRYLMYSVNTERFLLARHHPSWDDLPGN